MARPGPEWSNAPCRLLVVADAAGATLQLNLLRPLAAAVAAGACRLTVVTEADGPDIAWSARWDALRPHAVFASRYAGVGAAALRDEARRRGTPLVFHLDDNLFEVPEAAGAAKARRYRDPTRQAALRLLLEQADLVYLSTATLRDQITDHARLPAACVIGAIASASDPLPAPLAARGGMPVFGYMASGSHGPDLALAMPGILAALAARPGARFELFGSLAMPPPLAALGERVRHIAPVADYDGFLHRLRDLGWAWGLAPLGPGRFNAAKTDTKWVEYAAAGVPALVSAHPVYTASAADGAAIAVTDPDWASVLPAVLGDHARSGAVLARARARLATQYPLVRLTEQIRGVLGAAGVDATAVAALAPAGEGQVWAA